MKDSILNYELNLVKKYHADYTDIKLAEVKYGLEGLYMTFTKSIVIFTLAFILGIFKETLLMLLFFNILRSTGFGLHAKTSWECLLSSGLIFLFFPMISKYIFIPMIAKNILGIIAIILIFLYAPADTSKRPLIKKKKRDILKFKTTIKCIILVVLMIYINNNIISNLILFGIYCEALLINPFIYKLFNSSYNNYEKYNMS